MDAEKVKALKARAERATKVAGQIENVTKAKKFDDFDWALRDDALQIAKDGLLARLEAELTTLLGERQAVEPPGLTLIEPVKSESWIQPIGEDIKCY